MMYTLRTRKVLEKRDSMTMSDIEYLIKREVRKSDIAKALGMKLSEFTAWWSNESQIVPKKEIKTDLITVDEYKQLRKTGLKDKEIAELKGIQRDKLSAWKKKNRHAIGEESFRGKKLKDINITKAQYIEFRKQGLSEEEISKKIGVSRTPLRKWRNTKFTEKEIDELPSIARGKKLKLS